MDNKGTDFSLKKTEFGLWHGVDLSKKGMTPHEREMARRQHRMSMKGMERHGQMKGKQMMRGYHHDKED